MKQEKITALIQSLKQANPDCDCDPYVNEYVWNDKTVYVLAYKGPACDWIPTFYNSKGEEFALQAGDTYDIFIKESTFVKNVWTCKDENK